MEFREMRRKRQLLSDEESIKILEKMTNGTLAVQGDGGYPYAVPISYVYHEGHIYMHSALSGHKIDAIQRDDKASFSVVEQDHVVGAEFTTYFRSVIAFGRARLLDGDEKKVRVLRLLAEKYSKEETEEATSQEIEHGLRRVHIIDFEIEHLTGKEAIELVRGRKPQQ